MHLRKFPWVTHITVSLKNGKLLYYYLLMGKAEIKYWGFVVTRDDIKNICRAV